MDTERLKALRKEAGLTQTQVANQIKVAQNSYSNWEKGIRQPLMPTIEKLAELFNVSTDYLLGNSNEKKAYHMISEKQAIYDISKIDEDKLDKAIEKSLGFNGKPATEAEKESMKEALMIYLESLKK